MRLGRVLYGCVSSIFALILPLVLGVRVSSGKEDPARLNERRARDLPPRPDGTLIWMHGASVGETMVLLTLADALLQTDPGLNIVLTSQTQTSASMVAERAPDCIIHQMAPADTPAISQRFIAHWRPDAAIFAEGEIWPNLIRLAKRSGAKLALVNARMTAASTNGWTRWPAFSRDVFGAFDLISAADQQTQDALSRLSGKSVRMPGNLKLALAPPSASMDEIDTLRSTFLAGRKCLLAASTHPGEEEIVLEVLAGLSPRPALILAPRHPERADEIETLIQQARLQAARRSAGQSPSKETDIYLADTIGEMGTWLRLADATFLGGASVEGVGGHNPVEALQLNTPLVSGPHAYNFSAMFDELSAAGLLDICATVDEAAAALGLLLSGDVKRDIAARDAFLAQADAPLRDTADAVQNLLAQGRAQ